jgi:hypothetical protein
MTMSETTFEKQVINMLGSIQEQVNIIEAERGQNMRNMVKLQEEMHFIRGKFEDFFLSEADKKDICDALQEEKEGKLSTKEEVFS